MYVNSFDCKSSFSLFPCTTFRSSSFAEFNVEKDSPGSVHRSSSLKEDRGKSRKSKNRDSERRRTCLPVLTPSQSQEGIHSLNSQNDDSPVVFTISGVTLDQSETDDPCPVEPGEEEGVAVTVEGESRDDSVIVYQVGSEQLPVKEGQVRRRTQGKSGTCGPILDKI